MKALPKPRKEPRQARSQQMVDLILEATARVLAKNGYARTNTNLIAERAGVSVGSVYQYFPNKDSLIVAVHERHARQMVRVIDTILSGSGNGTLREQIAAMVRAWLAAHLVDPELHRVLERDLPFLDPPHDGNPSDQSIFDRVRRLLEERCDQITLTDRGLATWVVVNMVKSLVHAAVIEPPRLAALADIECAITDAVMGVLVGTTTIARSVVEETT